MLYNEAKGEHLLTSLINATVSHELRNPLYSLISQVGSMEQFFKKFKIMLQKVNDS